jgi:hypothetical protein
LIASSPAGVVSDLDSSIRDFDDGGSVPDSVKWVHILNLVIDTKVSDGKLLDAVDGVNGRSWLRCCQHHSEGSQDTSEQLAGDTTAVRDRDRETGKEEKEAQTKLCPRHGLFQRETIFLLPPQCLGNGHRNGCGNCG